MQLSAYLLFPLASAIIYVFGALLIKRAVDARVDIWRITFVSNILTALVFLVLLFRGGTFHAHLLWQPAIVGLLYVAGQFLTYCSLDGGHVSVATPVLSVKVILVALFTSMLLTQSVSTEQWIAAGLSTLAIVLLNRREGGVAMDDGSTARTIIYAALAAAAFALFDVLVQKWSPAWGAGRFLPVMLGFGALFALGMIPRFPARLRDLPPIAVPWVLGGCFFIALQSLIFVTALAEFGNGTAANVVYSSRGLWSVVFVWIIGHWFDNRERDVGSVVFRSRVIGATLMFAAVALVFVKKS